ncbi:HNH endonuclease [Streptomyces reniochalinae]|uniref:HNH endonuclease n=1 Tax=Streptomyces reniochalinae TaxID=2250578 RepID=A0A367EFZ9_9ACTN|nr:HNH endonuclease [Streptomyces reniochalinae]
MRHCFECSAPATHKGRCKAHHEAYENRASVRARRKRRAVIAEGNNAAALLRKEVRAHLRKHGYVTCASCPGHFLPSHVDVDHIIPLAKGGQDIASNVQVLCKPCHKVKTALDFGHLPF